jgi:hypothetical protein
MTSSPRLRRLGHRDVQARLVRWACCGAAAGGEPAETVRVIADFLRHGLCHLGSDAGEAKAVHVHQLLAALRRQLTGWLSPPDQPPWRLPDETRPVTPEEESAPAGQPVVKDLGLQVLRKLELLGDCGNRGAGYYLPTPTRSVRLPSGSSLLIGGLPTSVLREELGVAPAWAGLARACLGGGFLPDAIGQQSLSDWAGLPTEPLEKWTCRHFEEAGRGAASTSGLDPASFETYAPHVQPNQSQRYRWVSPRAWRRGPKIAGTQLSLCRTRARPYRFWLAPLSESSQGALFSQESAVPPGSSRRLMYGIDHLSGVPRSARVSPVSGGARKEREVRLFNWPAWEEYQILAALAHDCTPAEGPFLPIRYRVADEFWPDVQTVLQGLRIPLREEA